MLNLQSLGSSLVQRAQQLIDPMQGLNLSSSDKNPSKASLFQGQFRLPGSQTPLYEIPAELTIPPPGVTQGDRDRDGGWHYAGKLHISEGYLCFSTTPSSFVQSASTASSQVFTGQTHGAGPSGNGFTFPLCSIKRVERLNSQNFHFSLAITTWNGLLLVPKDAGKGGAKSPDDRKDQSREQRITLHLAGSRQACERFCDGLKRSLRAAVSSLPKLRAVVAECYSEYLLRVDDKDSKGAVSPPDAGLGMLFRYPGDPKKLRDRAKMRLWHEYLRDNGRNMTLIRQPTFHKLVRVGLPNRLRGEIWELTSGSLYQRLEKPSLYAETLAKHAGMESLAIDEIEKDLNRSLPEYPGFQAEDGIGRLRRVLTAYSWVNADVGYCQAMNIVVAALLIYMSEAQAFFLLSTLCDRLVPGYYSTTMYGTLLDQKVFECLVEKTMPILWDHLAKSDVQLSVVSLPWFLSLYINSMPLVYAFRVLDVFFVEGPKVLFQVGLAILRINGEDLLDAADDGAFISVLKSYFSRLEESAHPKSENYKLRAVTKFQELMVVAFKEFSTITHSSIVDLRLRNKNAVLSNIESFAKRTAIRNLGADSKLLGTEELGALYDKFYGVLYERQQRSLVMEEEKRRRASKTASRLRLQQADESRADDHVIERGRVGLGPNTSLMDYNAFREFLAGMSRWAISDNSSSNVSRGDRRSTSSLKRLEAQTATSSPWGGGPEPADHDFMRRLFRNWDSSNTGTLTLQNVVSGMARIKNKRDIMGAINYFFQLYDDDGDGKVDREGILSMSEALLFLSRRGLEGSLSPTNTTPLTASANGNNQRRSIHQRQLSRATSLTTPELTAPGVSLPEKFLGSVSAFIRRCFEYADPDHPSHGNLANGSSNWNSKAAFAPAAEDDVRPKGVETGAKGQNNPDSDLICLASPPTSPRSALHPAKSRSSNTKADAASEAARKVSKARSEAAANVALDPANPLHITLPTFRMVILADELMEQFLESSFPASFHLGDTPATSGSVGTPTTSFSNVNTMAPFASPSGTPSQLGPASQAGATKGLRGVLDGIVTAAGEFRRRVEEAQRELEKNATPTQRGEEDEEDEEEDEFGGGGGSSSSSKGGRRPMRSATIDSERRSVLSSDRDLLDGADAEAGARDETPVRSTLPNLSSPEPLTPSAQSVERVVDFDG